MKQFLAVLFLILLFAAGTMAETELSRDEQERIVNDFLWVTGQIKGHPDHSELSTESGPPVKCGTPSIIRYLSVKDKLDDDLKQSLSVLEQARPDLPLYYDSPDGHFRIHYSNIGSDTVYNASSDFNGNGVPDYIDTVAMVADSVWDVTINQLGFPEPVVDTFCTTADGPLYDIYVSDLSSNIFGQTWADVDCFVPGSLLMKVPSFLELDNDYQHVPTYRNRPLDAIRVTIAHEFFHAVQFGMDFTEFTGLFNGRGNLYWGEMSATWMEERLYDNINDYYAYLPFYFNDPHTSFQQFLDGADLHPYASVVFPLFLSQTYGDDIIRLIWEKEEEYGVGPHFLTATAFVIDSLTDGADSYEKAFGKFALWNFFAGPRTLLAPAGIGYEESAAWTATIPNGFPINDTLQVAIHDEADEYNLLVRADSNRYKPEQNATGIFRFENTQAIQEDRYWRCVDSLSFYSAVCEQDSTVSVETIDTTTEVYDVIDSAFTINLFLESMAVAIGSDTSLADWSVSLIFQDDLDAIEIDQLFIPSFPCSPSSCFNTGAALSIDRINRFKRVTMIVSPASPFESLYNERRGELMAYSIRERWTGDTTMPVEGGFTVEQVELFPYPNPAVIAEMSEKLVRFKLGIMDVFGDPYVGLPSVRVRTVINIFDLAGNIVFVSDVTQNRDLMEFFGEGSRDLEVTWDMNNQAGKPVASGVYMGVAEIYINRQKVAEGVGKVAIIR